ncbi:MAG: hypothetical protein JWO49_2619 [Arthrobacter sp.]|nr:hypothetical protein [Arthrobacter sp.]MCU1548730.1 hypothetical protein [Arthrobacter sp.]
MAGIAALVLTGVLGTAMGLNNTATFMSSCVAFVAVCMGMDSRITRRRREAARNAAHPSGRGAPGSDADGAFGSGTPERDGRST